MMSQPARDGLIEMARMAAIFCPLTPRHAKAQENKGFGVSNDRAR